MGKEYICVNTFAPKDDVLYVFFKKYIDRKSDGFCIICNGDVFIIDSGNFDDDGLLWYLLSVYNKWLENAPESIQKQNARLEINIIVTHSHFDHVGAMDKIVSHPQLEVMSVIAPEMSNFRENMPEVLEILQKFEGCLTNIGKLWKKDIQYLPFGKVHTITPQNKGFGITIYTSPFNWADDSEGIRYLKNNVPSSYGDEYARGVVNGIMNGNSLWVKITKGEQAVLFTGDQRATDEMLGEMIRYHGEKEFRCDVLKLTHHGDDNYPPYLIEVSKAKHFVFTISRDRATPATVELCEKVGKAHYLDSGNLIFELNGTDKITETVYDR